MTTSLWLSRTFFNKIFLYLSNNPWIISQYYEMKGGFWVFVLIINSIEYHKNAYTITSIFVNWLIFNNFQIILNNWELIRKQIEKEKNVSFYHHAELKNYLSANLFQAFHLVHRHRMSCKGSRLRRRRTLDHCWWQQKLEASQTISPVVMEECKPELLVHHLSNKKSAWFRN